MIALFPSRPSDPKNSDALSIVRDDISAIFLPARVTERLSGFSRVPWQSEHGLEVMNVSIQRLIASERVW